MAAPEASARGLRLGAVAVAVAFCGYGCASSGSEAARAAEPLPPQAVVPPPASQRSPGQAPADESAGARPDRRADRQEAEPTLIVIDPAEPEELRKPSLAEAAASERARRREESQPVLVVTNQNLAQHAAGGVLTIAHTTPDDEATDETATDPELRESYWREKGLEIRKRWKEAADSVPELEEKVAELRNRFYATDDPAMRDGQIKPLWDKALADLEEARYQVAKGAEEVMEFLEEGRRAGALPGWLREGVELEPEPVVEERGDLVVQEAQEPAIYDPPPGP